MMQPRLKSLLWLVTTTGIISLVAGCNAEQQVDFAATGQGALDAEKNQSNDASGKSGAHAGDDATKNGDVTSATVVQASAQVAFETKEISADSILQNLPVEGADSSGSVLDGSVSEKLLKSLTPISEEFASSRVENRSSKMDLKYDRIEVGLELSKASAATTEVFTQIQREMKTDDFQQGNSGKETTDTFKQEDRGIADILFVIDNSGSMNQEQANVSTKLNKLLTYISDSNWRIGFVTTDPANPCMRAVISKGEADIEKRFADAVNAGVTGSGNERGILQAVNGLRCESNKWLRTGSSVGVIIVSDEDNCSNGQGCPDPEDKNTPPKQLAYASENYLLDYLKGIRTLGSDARVYGIVGIAGSACKTAVAGTIYKKAVDASGGTIGDICSDLPADDPKLTPAQNAAALAAARDAIDANFSNTLMNVSKNINETRKNNFLLAHKPEAGSARVYVNGAEWTSGYTITDRTVNFTMVPPAASTIEVKYRYDAVPIVQSVVLSKKAAPGTLKVMLNGKEVAANTYQYDANTQTINFAAAPAEDTTIKAQYLVDQMLLSDWKLSGQAVGGSVKVSVNGVADGAPTLLNGDTIHFANPPIDGTKITVSYGKWLDPILDYPLKVMLGTLPELKAVDKNSGAAIPVSFDKANLHFDAKDWSMGRQVVVSYRDVPAFSREFDLGATPVPGSVVITIGDDTPCAAEGMKINGQKIQVACDTKGASTISFAYSAILDKATRFKVSGVKHPELYEWKATSGAEDKALAFHREGNEFSIDDELAPGAKVKITGIPLVR